MPAIRASLGPKELKLNIGCGPTGQIDGFENLDNSPSVLISRIPLAKIILFYLGLTTKDQYEAKWSGVIFCDVGKQLPYKDNAVDKIYSSHCLEHIPYAKALHLLKQCYRVLKNDGVMRLVVPDLLWHAERYTEKTKVLLKKITEQGFSNDRSCE